MVFFGRRDTAGCPGPRRAVPWSGSCASSALPDAWLLAIVRDLRQLELAGDDVDVRSRSLQSVTLLVYAIASAPLPGGGDVESVGGSPALDRLQALYRQAAFDELLSRITGIARSPRPLPLVAIQAAALSSPHSA